MSDSEQRYRVLFETIQDGILIVNEQGVYVDVNESLCRMLKAPRERLVGAHFSEFIPAERLEEAIKAFASLRESRPTPMIFPLRAVDGTLVELEWTSSARLLPGLYFCVCRDLTERRRTEEALWKTQEESRTLLAAIPDVISRFDRNLRFVFVNAAIERVTGRAPEYFIGKNHAEAELPLDLPERLLKPILETGKPVTIQFDFVSPRLGRLHMHAIGVPEFSTTGTLTTMLAIVRDITDQTRAQEDLAKERAMLRLVLEQMPSGAVVAEAPSGDIVLWNRQLEKMWRQSVTPRNISDFEGYRPDGTAYSADEWPLARAIREGEEVNCEEIQVLREDGSKGILEVSAKPIRNDSGHIVAGVAISTDVTERRTFERATLHLAAIVESSEDAIISKDLNGVITSWNSAAERIFGYTEEEAVGQPIAMLAVPERLNELPSIMDMIRSGRRVEHYETVRRRKSGEPMFVALTISPIRNAAGQIIGASKIVRDITEWKRQQESLRETNEQFYTLANAMPQLAWMAHGDGSIFWYNQRWYEYTGMSPEQLPGWDWLQIHDPVEFPKVLERWNHCIETGEPFEMVFPLRGVDGVFRHFLTRVLPIRDAGGRVVRWLGTNTDISQQKRTEDALRHAQEERTLLLGREMEARQTAELLNRVGPMLSAELDPRNLIQKVTDFTTKLTNADFGVFFKRQPGEDGDGFTLQGLSGIGEQVLAGLPAAQITTLFGPEFSEGVLRCDDTYKDPRAVLAPGAMDEPTVRSYLTGRVVSRSGEVLGGLFFAHREPGVFTPRDEQIIMGIVAQAGIALDNARLFTQAQKAQEALQRSNDELWRANADLRQFAYSASHDLQEPLRMVSIFTQLLKTKYGSRLDGEADVYIGHAVQGANRMESLVRDLLSYIKISDTIETPVAMADSAAVLDATLAGLGASITQSGAVVTHGPLPMVPVHAVHLQQVFQNLVGNAIKYRSNDVPKIHVSAVLNDNTWFFSVEDNGIGIEAQYAEHVFGLFKRLHSNHEYEGTGIGLAICQKIVERYGGRIWVESEPGKGSTFRFTIPFGETASVQ